MSDASRDRPRWTPPVVACLGLCLVSWLLVFVGLVIGSPALWTPASVVFVLAFVGGLVCQVRLARRAVAERRRQP